MAYVQRISNRERSCPRCTLLTGDERRANRLPYLIARSVAMAQVLSSSSGKSPRAACRMLATLNRRQAILALAVGALSACAAPPSRGIAPPGGRWRSTLRTGHPLVGTIWNLHEGRRASDAELQTRLVSARYRLLGEVHDNPDHHALQLALLHSLAHAGRRPLVAFEQFDAEHDRSLQDALARREKDPEIIADAVRFDRKGWNWSYYRPLVEAALAHGLPLRAANLSNSTTRRIAREGLHTLGAGRIADLDLDTPWDAQRDAALRDLVFESHCRALPPRQVASMVQAQRARDATLAGALRDAGPDGVVLICGNGHARRDLGVPIYLAASAVVCSVGLAEVETGKHAPGDYGLKRIGPIAPFDFVCFTPAWDRPDPCAGFHARGGADGSTPGAIHDQKPVKDQ